MDKEFTQEELQQVEDYAHDLMSWKEIAALMDIPVMDFYTQFTKSDSEVNRAYQKGKVRRKHELRKSILSLASKGSPQAELLSVKFMDEQKLSETDE